MIILVTNMLIWEAQLQRQRSHTRVWRGNARMSLLVRQAASCHVFFFFFSWLAPMRLRLGPIRVESGQLKPYWAKQLKWPIQAKIQKKKKKVQNTPFELNNKPYFSSLHPNNNFSSLSLRHSSLTLSVLFASLSLLSISSVAVRHSATQSLRSNFSSLSRILNLVIDIKLSILVWFVICDLWFVNLWFVNLSFQS